jgi:hypothetical protein
MNNKKLVLPLLFILMGSAASVQAQKKGNLEISGNYLGMFNSLHPRNAPDTLAKNRQFDAAANLDVLWKIHHKIRGNIQLQMGTGFGSIDFAVSNVVVTDLNLEIEIHPKFVLTLGSFDTPFGADTPYLSNNASTLDNLFILNTLFYGVFAGTDVGTLNTVGLKGYYQSKFADLTAAVTNGTDESAFNPDGNFGFVISGLTAPILTVFQGGLSIIYSSDSSKAGSSGTASGFSGGMIDAIFNLDSTTFIKAYLGRMNYDDNRAVTDDHVIIWKIEGQYPISRGYLAARVSSWLPEVAGNDSSGVNVGLPPAGTGWRQSTIAQVTDQRVHRYQLGFGWPVISDMYLKAELFYDHYLTERSGIPYDITGFIMGLNAKF